MDEIRSRPEPVAAASADPLAGRLEQLQQLFPEAFAEGKVDFDQLRVALGDAVEGRPERYSFTWAGKRDAMRILQMPTRATLIPAPEESVNWDTTRHLLIEGDNLEVLKLLLKPYYGRVKMVYIDPPYNTGNDFIYPDNYADPLDTYLRLTGQKNAAGNLLTSNPETSGRYHSAWLSMMYPRLFLARQLLREDGIIFISIDDNELHDLALLMNEAFGEENFITCVIWQKVFSPKNTAKYFSVDHDYILVYARDIQTWLPELLPRTDEADARYSNPDNDPRGAWTSSDLTARNYYSQGQYEVTGPTGRKFGPGMGRYWRSAYEKFLELDRDKRVWWGEDGNGMPRLKRFLSEVRQGIVPQTLWTYQEVGHTQEAKKELLAEVSFGHTENVLNTVKPTRLIRRMLQISTEPAADDVVVDFFAGSCPTAQAVLEQNREDEGTRRFIMVQLPEPLPTPEARLRTIADIGKERIRRVIARLQAERAGQLDLRERETPEDLGFKLFKLAPSNFQSWFGVAQAEGGEYARQMALFADALVEGWTPERVVAEVALKEAGFGLNYRTERAEAVKQQTVFRVVDDEREQHFYICLDDQLRLETLRPLELQREDLFVCRGKALDDEAAANLALQCRLRTI